MHAATFSAANIPSCVTLETQTCDSVTFFNGNDLWNGALNLKH